MSALENLLNISSPATGTANPSTWGLPAFVATILSERNGLFAFENALEVFPSGNSNLSHGIFEWNKPDLWIRSFGKFKPNGVCFAQDVFGNQFVAAERINIFDAETGEVTDFAKDTDEWAERLLEEYEVFTGQSLAHQWQTTNGPIPFKHRLVPLTPFVLGGEYNLENLVAVEAARSMRIRGPLALQIAEAPDGTSITYEIQS